MSNDNTTPILQFDGLNEAFEFMRQREQEANDRATDEQKAVDYGDYFWRLETLGPETIAIFTRCPTLDELAAIERRLGADEEEVTSELEMIEDAHKRGYRYGQHFSVVEPEGEWGSCHVASIVGKITAEDFELARRHGWRYPQWLAAVLTGREN